MRSGQLTAVEDVGVDVFFSELGRRIGVWIPDATVLAERAGAHNVDGVDEEGCGGGGKDETVGWEDVSRCRWNCDAVGYIYISYV